MYNHNDFVYLDDINPEFTKYIDRSSERRSHISDTDMRTQSNTAEIKRKKPDELQLALLATLFLLKSEGFL